MTLTNVAGHLYYYGAQLLCGAQTKNPAGTTVTDAKIDWTSDNIYICLVGPASNVAFSQSQNGTSGGHPATQIYYSDIAANDIAAQATVTFPNTFTGNTPYSAAGGSLLTTIAPGTDTSAAPLYYAEMVGNCNSYNAGNAAPVGYWTSPNTGYTTNGIMWSNMTYSAMQGAVIYKKTGGANTTWPLIGYLDLSGGSVNSLLVDGTHMNGATAGYATVKVTSGTGFVNGQTVTLFDSTPQAENLTISSGGGTTTLTMTGNVINHYTAANNAYCIQANNASADKFTLTFDATGIFKQLIA